MARKVNTIARLTQRYLAAAMWAIAQICSDTSLATLRESENELVKS